MPLLLGAICRNLNEIEEARKWLEQAIALASAVPSYQDWWSAYEELALLEKKVGNTAAYEAAKREAVQKLCTLPLLAGENISSQFVIPTVASCFDVVVHCMRTPDGHRQVAEIVGIGNRVENGVIETSSLFRRIGGDLVCTASEVPSRHKFEARGVPTEGLVVADRDLREARA